MPKTMTIEELEREAIGIAFRAHGGETKEQAFTRLLEASPELYAFYRAEHNAGPLLIALKAAGISIQRT